MGALALKMTLRTTQPRSDRRARAFTLIELIIVMAMLVTIIAVTFPSLQRFFRGRTLESEARRFLTLTRYAQNRAVAEAIPMVLWIDENDRSYGLEAQTGFLEKDDKAVSYVLDEKIEVEVETSKINRASLRPEQQRRRPVSVANLPEIIFSPDGSIEVMSTVDAVRFVGSDDSELWVNPTRNHLGFEVANERADAN